MPFEVHLYYFCPNDMSLVRWLHSKIGFQACTAHLLLRFEVYAYSARNDEAHCGDTNPNQVLQVSSFFSVCSRHWVLVCAARSIPVMFIFVPNTTTNNPYIPFPSMMLHVISRMFTSDYSERSPIQIKAFWWRSWHDWKHPNASINTDLHNHTSSIVKE